MANANLPTGFELYWPKDAFCLDYLVADGLTIKKGDVVYIDSNGYASSTDGVTFGVAMDNMHVGTTGATTTTAAAATYDYVNVCIDVQAIFKGQISTGLLTDPYTTLSSDLAYDEAGTSGAQYIDAAASSTLTWKIVRYSSEYLKGNESPVGTYQKVFCKFNPVVHAFGCIA